MENYIRLAEKKKKTIELRWSFFFLTFSKCAFLKVLPPRSHPLLFKSLSETLEAKGCTQREQSTGASGSWDRVEAGRNR